MKKDKKILNPMIQLLQPEVEELIKNKHWGVLKDVISTWHASDIADLFREIDAKDYAIILRILPQKLQAEVFSYLDSDIQ
ncbi:MAG: hypothetical protein J7L64_01135, partial [Acidobacteria bacterium]|nr:hypothetical protein [Acidobacteriota bacterium]